jgi:hypothetical protein
MGEAPWRLRAEFPECAKLRQVPVGAYARIFLRGPDGMVSSSAGSVAAYMAELPPERRAIVSAVRDLVNCHLPPGYVESMAWGMICWGIPLARYPDTYNKQPLGYVALAAQKNAYSLYLMNVYADSAGEATLRAAYARAGKKLDMGKCCLRFKSLDGLLFDEIGRLIAETSVEEYIARYEAVKKAGPANSRSSAARRATTDRLETKRAADKHAAARKPPANEVAARKTVAKDSVTKQPAVKAASAKSSGKKRSTAK